MLTKEDWVLIFLLAHVNAVRRNLKGKLQPESLQLTAAKLSWMVAKTPLSGIPLPPWLVWSQWYPGQPLPAELSNIPEDQEHPEFTAIYNSDYTAHIKEMKKDLEIRKAAAVFRPSTALAFIVDNLFWLGMTGIAGTIQGCFWVAATEGRLARDLALKIYGEPELLTILMAACIQPMNDTNPTNACAAPVMSSLAANEVEQPNITAAVEEELALQPTASNVNQGLNVFMSQEVVEVVEGSEVQPPADTSEIELVDGTAMSPRDFYLSASFNNGDLREGTSSDVVNRAFMTSLSAAHARAPSGSNNNNNNESNPDLETSKSTGLKHGSEPSKGAQLAVERNVNQGQNAVGNSNPTGAPICEGVNSVTSVAAPTSSVSTSDITNVPTSNCTSTNKSSTKKPSFFGRAWRAVSQFVQDTRNARDPLTEDELEGMQSCDLIN